MNNMDAIYDWVWKHARIAAREAQRQMREEITRAVYIYAKPGAIVAATAKPDSEFELASGERMECNAEEDQLTARIVKIVWGVRCLPDELANPKTP